MIYLFAFFSSLGFAILYNVRGRLIFWSAFGGAVGQFFFDLSGSLGAPRTFFVATLALALYAELMARFTKVPVMIYIVVGVLPIVPGAGVYRTMDSLFHGDRLNFYQYGTETLLASGAIALALLVVSSTVRLIKLWRFPILTQHQKPLHKKNIWRERN